MTAPILRHLTRRPLYDMPAHVVNDADYINRRGKPRPAGQLWERAAEAATVEPRRDADMELGERGPAVVDRPESTLSNGILRAGVLA